MTNCLKKLSILLAVLAALTGFDRVCAGAVAVSLTPNAVSNTYTGTITLNTVAGKRVLTSANGGTHWALGQRVPV